jgi:hypothetical protein
MKGLLLTTWQLKSALLVLTIVLISSCDGGHSADLYCFPNAADSACQRGIAVLNAAYDGQADVYCRVYQYSEDTVAIGLSSLNWESPDFHRSIKDRQAYLLLRSGSKIPLVFDFEFNGRSEIIYNCSKEIPVSLLMTGGVYYIKFSLTTIHAETMGM